MPTGFDTPSGSRLKQKDVEVAEWVGAYLQKMRDNGDATPENPLCGAAICEMGEKMGKSISGTMLRALINWLRQNMVPIASCSGGYFYAKYPAELTGTISHLKDRISGIQKAIDGLEKCFDGQKELL
jgi:hypothetical protein